MIRSAGRRQQLWVVVALIGWVTWGGLCAPVVQAAITPGKTAELEIHHPQRLQRDSVRQELSRSTVELQGLSNKGLRAYVERLGLLHSSLESESGIPLAERRDLTERLLLRAAQVGLMLQERGEASGPSGRSREAAPVQSGLAVGDALSEMLWGNPMVFAGLVGGLVIVFALGNLLGYRHGARQASYYGEGDPRIRFLARPPAHPAPQGQSERITLPLIRDALSEGRTVLLQLGYDVAPSHRLRYLELVRQMRQALERAEGLTYSAWEDPRHPHRFYELLACKRLAALDVLTANDGALTILGDEIEACRLPAGLTRRRIWWAVPLQAEGASHLAPVREDTPVREEVG
jgi:hypothetical protein